MESFKKTCIVCPIGCRLTISRDDEMPEGYRVEGHTCKRGEAYGIKEVTNPTRILTSTVKIKEAYLRRLPVVTHEGIPKDKLFQCMEIINEVEVEAPVKAGDSLIENIADTGIDVIASRTMTRV